MQKTTIEYLKYTWNPMAKLCTPTESPGCKNCWHRRMAPRLAGNSHFTKEERAAWAGTGLPVLRKKELEDPARLKKPSIIGVQFMGDLFHPRVSFSMILKIFGTMLYAPWHTYLILTKRPERMARFYGWWIDEATKRHYLNLHVGMASDFDFIKNLPDDEKSRANQWYLDNCDQSKRGPYDDPVPWPWPHVWLGISASNQADLDRWGPILMQIPAAKLFLSLEPLLGPVDVHPYTRKTPEAYKWLSKFYDKKGFMPEGDQPEKLISRIDGIVAGGESGPGARPSHPDWFRKVRDQCAASGVPFTFKQWGGWEIASAENGHMGSVMADTGEKYTWIGKNGKTFNPSAPKDQDCWAMVKVGKKTAGRMLDGQIHNGWPVK